MRSPSATSQPHAMEQISQAPQVGSPYLLTIFPNTLPPPFFPAPGFGVLATINYYASGVAAHAGQELVGEGDDRVSPAHFTCSGRGTVMVWPLASTRV